KVVFNGNGTPHYIDTVRYLNIPWLDTVLVVNSYEEDKLLMFHRWDSLRSLEPPDPITDPITGPGWRIAKYDSRIYATRLRSDTFEHRIVPYYGLPLAEWRSSTTGDFLRGKANRYCV